MNSIQPIEEAQQKEGATPQNGEDQLSLAELEKLHTLLFQKISARFGHQAAVRTVAKALLLPEVLDRNGSGDEVVAIASVATKLSGVVVKEKGLSRKSRWQRAFEVAMVEQRDPWLSRGIHLLPMQHGVRHRFHPGQQGWMVDDVLVKVESRPFAEGAMRECYAMKKLSTFSNSVYRDWGRAPNFVAKRYKRPADRAVYFDDVKLQMDSKRLGELYDQTDPPKKVDVLQACVIEIEGGAGGEAMAYSVEHLIEGEYVKYSSNSGFVADEFARNTPHAFSHFTFEVTKGKQLCVDIQGVGDLYTDPQIHTVNGTEYGEGNLGLRGMGLFFRSHECNPLCCRLHLKPFPRCEADLRVLHRSSSSTSSSGNTMSRTMMRSATARRAAEASCQEKVAAPEPKHKFLRGEHLAVLSHVPPEEDPFAGVHLEVAKLHAEVLAMRERYAEDEAEACLEAGLFHLLQAARSGATLALCVMARVHAGIAPSSALLAHISHGAMHDTEELAEDAELAMRYAELAAERGVRSAAAAFALHLATGVGESDQAQDALRWYDRALGEEGPSPEAEEEASSLPGASLQRYELLAAKAQLIVQGGKGLGPDPPLAAEVYNEAAELATLAGKGKLAQHYYTLAAEAEG